MKIKTFAARNARMLEVQFNEWWTPDTVIYDALLSTDRSDNLTLVVFYDIFQEPLDQGDQVRAETVDELMEELETPDEPKPETEVTIDTAAPLSEELCRNCNCLNYPTVVGFGRYKGRRKCSECGKTYEPAETEVTDA